MHSIGVVGYGEIGSAVFEIYKEKGYEVGIVDPYLGHSDDIAKCNILNICIPYSDDFVSIVNKYIDTYAPNITVIHSTVAPGTTKNIKGKVCHSPVRGIHPNLKDGIKTFLKYIGSESQEVAQEYYEHLLSLDISAHICKDSLTSEYAKLLDTTYYGLCIAFHSDVMDLCEKNNIDFEEVMTIYNKTYNEGYSNFGKNNVIRPVLYPTKQIGGHCVVPNAEILLQSFDSDALRYILKYK